MNKEYFDCIHNLWTGFVGKATCEAGYLKCDGLSCPMYTQKKVLKSMTHFDEIKEMSAEELAQWIDHIQVDAYARGLMGEPVVDYPNIYSGWIEWLRSQADKEGE